LTKQWCIWLNPYCSKIATIYIPLFIKDNASWFVACLSNGYLCIYTWSKDCMIKTSRKLFLTLVGAIFVFLGILFILLPGPAVLFLPLGLALLSLEYAWAKSWLRKCQVWMRKSAVKADNGVAWIRRRCR